MVLLVFALCGIPTLVIFGLLFALPIWCVGVLLQLIVSFWISSWAQSVALDESETGLKGRAARFVLRHSKHPGFKCGKDPSTLTYCALIGIWSREAIVEADRWVEWRKAHDAFVESGRPLTVTEKVWSVLGYRYDKERENPEYEREVDHLHIAWFLNACCASSYELKVPLDVVERELAAYRRWKAGVRDYLRDPGAPLA